MTRIPGYLRHLYPTNWNDISKRAKARDHWCCRGCEERYKLFGFSLETHHIDSNPQNIADDNLIALCDLCHSKVKGMMPQPRTRLEVIQRLRQLGNSVRLRF